MGTVLDLKTRQALVKEVHRKQLVKELGEPTSNFFRTSHLTLEDPHFIKLSPPAKTLYLYLCKARNRFQRQHAYFTRSDRQLVKDSGLSRSAIGKAKQELQAYKFVVCKSKPGGRTKYLIMEFDKLARSLSQ